MMDVIVVVSSNQKPEQIISVLQERGHKEAVGIVQ